MNKLGKKGKANAAALRIQRLAFAEARIFICEGRWQGCLGTYTVGFAHTKKRVDLSPDELTYAVCLLCTSCHNRIEMPGDHAAMEQAIRYIILGREATGAFFDRAREVVR